jgi:hypothetical protein
MRHSNPARHGWRLVGAGLLFALSLGACDAGNTPTPRTAAAPGIGTNPGSTGGTSAPAPAAGGSAPAHAPPGPPPNPPDRATGTTPVTPLINDSGSTPQSRAPAGTGSTSGGAGTSGMAGSGAAAGSGGSTDERR